MKKRKHIFSAGISKVNYRAGIMNRLLTAAVIIKGVY